jgi:hypothetical protein
VQEHVVVREHVVGITVSVMLRSRSRAPRVVEGFDALSLGSRTADRTLAPGAGLAWLRRGTERTDLDATVHRQLGW